MRLKGVQIHGISFDRRNEDFFRRERAQNSSWQKRKREIKHIECPQFAVRRYKF